MKDIFTHSEGIAQLLDRTIRRIGCLAAFAVCVLFWGFVFWLVGGKVSLFTAVGGIVLIVCIVGFFIERSLPDFKDM